MVIQWRLQIAVPQMFAVLFKDVGWAIGRVRNARIKANFCVFDFEIHFSGIAKLELAYRQADARARSMAGSSLTIALVQARAAQRNCAFIGTFSFFFFFSLFFFFFFFFLY